ncbi:MAG: hypothetical protein PHC75_06590 [Burkholderiales bacterium]|nr:hypothetical protein [Burkholderiales bacterium]
MNIVLFTGVGVDKDAALCDLNCLHQINENDVRILSSLDEFQLTESGSVSMILFSPINALLINCLASSSDDRSISLILEKWYNEAQLIIDFIKYNQMIQVCSYQTISEVSNEYEDLIKNILQNFNELHEINASLLGVSAELSSVNILELINERDISESLSLNDKNKQLDSKLLESEQKCEAYLTELLNLNDKNKQLESKLLESEHKCEAYFAELLSLNDKDRQLGSKLSEFGQKCEAYLAELLSLNDKNKQLESKLLESEQKREAYFAELSILSDKNEQLENEILESEQKREAYFAELSILNDKNEQLEGKLSESEKNINLLSIQVSMFEGQIEMIKDFVMFAK